MTNKDDEGPLIDLHKSEYFDLSEPEKPEWQKHYEKPNFWTARPFEHHIQDGFDLFAAIVLGIFLMWFVRTEHYDNLNAWMSATLWGS